MDESGVLNKKLKENYRSLFNQQWSPLTGGILLGLLSILILAWSRPWGIVGGIRNWADWLFYLIGVFPEKPNNPFFYSSSIMDIGLIMGAFASALAAKEFALRIPQKSK
ncbi:MAG: YeeE/YedE family protein [Deltaproteobacteria bacterium]|nr:YeeE/YedE family protein [Deltaproteobacteria bacterium]